MAVTWQLLFSRVLKAPVPLGLTVALFGFVWAIYVADRLLDVRHGSPATARHAFYREHGRRIAPWVAGVGVGLLGFVSSIDWPVMCVVLPISALVALHFITIHHFSTRWWPKEMVVGLVFALGTGLPVWASAPVRTWMFWPGVLLFSSLCYTNCLAIQRWEQGRGGSVRGLALGLAGVGLVALFYTPLQLLSLSVVAGAELLAWLDLSSDALSLDALRVLADAALLTPAVLLALTRLA